MRYCCTKAGPPGLEPGIVVLETTVLPLKLQTPKETKENKKTSKPCDSMSF